MPRAAGVFGAAAKPILEIRPLSPFVVFYGEQSESQPAELTGKLVLSNAESMHVKSIRLTLTGMRKVSWSTTKTVTPQPIVNKTRFLHEVLDFMPGDHKSHKINAGRHEWDFKFTLPGNSDESVEGIPTNWIVYDLHASVDRGYITKQLTATSHIRVIRTLSRDLTESVPMEQINEDIWASKLAYKITVPQKNFIVGTSITADFVLIPLRKGVEIMNIKMELVESRQLFCEYAGRRISHQFDHVVVQKEGPMPENSVRMVPSGIEGADDLFDESHRFTMSIPLPRSLKNCRQSVDTENVRLTHKLRIYVNLHNPEGHTSQLLVKNSVHLFISPNLPPNEDQSVTVDQDIINSAAIRDEVNQNAPPLYGLHTMDELYHDIDPSGFMTPGGIMTPGGRLSMANSGANTPLRSHSGQGSADNLASLDAMTQQNDGGASALALHHRLNNLNLNQLNRGTRFTPQRFPSYTPSAAPSAAPSYPSSGHTTPPNAPDDYFANYDMAALTRTPSYNTAVRTPGPTPLSEDLPTYELAISRPSSPIQLRMPRSGQSSPLGKDYNSEDPLEEETHRNTQLNSRRDSPRRQPNDDAVSHRSNSASSASSASSSASTSSSIISPTTSAPPAPNHLAVPRPPHIRRKSATASTTAPSSSGDLAVPRPQHHRSHSYVAAAPKPPSRPPLVSFRSEAHIPTTLNTPHINPFRRILKNIY